MIKAKKSLGQNFLRSSAAIEAIVTASGAKEGVYILEIGPGEGALTEKLLATGAIVVAVEKDDRLIELLTARFENYHNKTFFLIHGDILEEDIEALQRNYFSQKDFKLVANIPYYITGQIIRLFVDSGLATSMTLLVQDEVAKRIVKRDEKESLLSLAIASYGTAHYIKKVPAGSFVPAPKVDSAIIHINRYEKPVFGNQKEGDTGENRERKLYFALIHAGLAHKRKTLLHNFNVDKELSAILPHPIDWTHTLTRCGLDTKTRGEDVDFDTWLKVMRAILD